MIDNSEGSDLEEEGDFEGNGCETAISPSLYYDDFFTTGFETALTPPHSREIRNLFENFEKLDNERKKEKETWKTTTRSPFILHKQIEFEEFLKEETVPAWIKACVCRKLNGEQIIAIKTRFKLYLYHLEEEKMIKEFELSPTIWKMEFIPKLNMLIIVIYGALCRLYFDEDFKMKNDYPYESFHPYPKLSTKFQVMKNLNILYPEYASCARIVEYDPSFRGKVVSKKMLFNQINNYFQEKKYYSAFVTYGNDDQYFICSMDGGISVYEIYSQACKKLQSIDRIKEESCISNFSISGNHLFGGMPKGDICICSIEEGISLEIKVLSVVTVHSRDPLSTGIESMICYNSGDIYSTSSLGVVQYNIKNQEKRVLVPLSYGGVGWGGYLQWLNENEKKYFMVFRSSCTDQPMVSIFENLEYCGDEFLKERVGFVFQEIYHGNFEAFYFCISLRDDMLKVLKTLILF